MPITINGASDDIIEINGDITEELNVLGHERGTLTLSDGTVIRYDLTDEDDGTWRFKVDKAGAAKVVVHSASAARRPVYSDHVVVEGDVESVRCDGTGDEAPLPADTALDATTGPLPFFALAPDLEVRKADPEALGTYWLAFAEAHYKALDGALSGSQAKRDAHLFAYMAGFTIAALTHDWTPDRIAAAFEDGASAAEFTWQWLNEAGVDADRVESISALYERMDKREAERGDRAPVQVQTVIEDHLTD